MLRRLSSRPLLAAVAGAFVLAGCGGVHPGDAVVVGDERLSMSKLDALADAGCAYLATAAASQGSVAPSQGAVRQILVTQELQLAGSRLLSEELDLDVPRSRWALGAEDLEQLETMFRGRADDVQEILERDFESQALRTAIGADVTGTAVTQENTEQLLQSGTEAVVEELRRVDATVDPRFGLDAEGQPDPGLSLSASREQLAQEDPATVPANQRCRGVESSE